MENEDKRAISVDLVLGKQVIPTTYQNMYKLVINNMHGDADGTTYTETFFNCKEKPLLEDILLLLEDSSRWLLNRDEISDKLTEICSKHINLIDPDENKYYEDYAWELVDHDHRYEGYICKPTLESLTFFDESGAEYNVNLKFKYKK